MVNELTFKNGTKIAWNWGDDGGGPEHYKDFLKVIPSNSKFKRCLEWCAGCSAISFSLLDAGIIDELVVMDIYKPALDQVIINAKNNQLYEVTAYHIDQVSKLPEYENFDLVVANPPHGCDLILFRETMSKYPDFLELSEAEHLMNERITIDTNWQAHIEFYKNIGKHLNPGANLYISECLPLDKVHLTLSKKAGFTFKNITPCDTGVPASIGIAHFVYDEKEIY